MIRVPYHVIKFYHTRAEVSHDGPATPSSSYLGREVPEAEVRARLIKAGGDVQECLEGLKRAREEAQSRLVGPG